MSSRAACLSSASAAFPALAAARLASPPLSVPPSAGRAPAEQARDLRWACGSYSNLT